MDEKIHELLDRLEHKAKCIEEGLEGLWVKGTLEIDADFKVYIRHILYSNLVSGDGEEVIREPPQDIRFLVDPDTVCQKNCANLKSTSSALGLYLYENDIITVENTKYLVTVEGSDWILKPLEYIEEMEKYDMKVIGVEEWLLKREEAKKKFPPKPFFIGEHFQSNVVYDDFIYFYNNDYKKDRKNSMPKQVIENIFHEKKVDE